VKDDMEGGTVSVSVATPTYTEGKLSRLETTEIMDRNFEMEVDPDAGIYAVTKTLEAPTRS
jgi:hypothetical protein